MSTLKTSLHICPGCKSDASFSVQNYQIGKNQSLLLFKCRFCNLQRNQTWTKTAERELIDRNITSQYYRNYNDGLGLSESES
jgi:transposase-like protein